MRRYRKEQKCKEGLSSQNKKDSQHTVLAEQRVVKDIYSGHMDFFRFVDEKLLPWISQLMEFTFLTFLPSIYS